MLLARSKTVVDVVDQAATIGELHHAIVSGLVSKDDVHAQLGEIVAGRRAGRNSSDEIIVFDSNGMALQDVIVAAAVYQKASIEGLGTARDLCARNNANGKLLHRSPNILLIPGKSSLQHLRESLQAAQLELPTSAIVELNAIYARRNAQSH